MKEKDNRMKYAIVVSLIISAFVIIGSVNAETLELESNDKCVYMPEINKDFCKTEYELCDTKLSLDKVSFLYGDFTGKAELDEKEFKTELEGIETEIKIEDKGGCYKVEISGYKSPLTDIDNVLCFNDNCHYEYVLWIGTYKFRNAIYGNASVSAATSSLVPVNMTMNSSQELFWCNFTLTSTNETIGYVYWNNNTDYICIDEDETSARVTLIDEGNGTDYKTGIDLSMVAFYNMNSSTMLDIGLYGADYVNETNITTTNGITGNAVYSDASNNSQAWLKVPSKSFPFNFSFMGWIYRGSDIDSLPLNYYEASTDFLRLMEISSSNDWISTVNKPNNVLKINAHSSANTLPVDQWVHIAIIIDVSVNNGINYYFNGQKDATTVDAWNAVSGTLDDFTSDLSMSEYGGSYNFNGAYDNIMFFNRTLSEDEINASYYSQVSLFGFGEVETNVTVPVLPSNVTINLSIERSFCYDDSHLYLYEKDINTTGNAVFNEYLQYCKYGCDNYTWRSLGYPSCKESPLEIVAVGIIIIILFILIMRFFL